MIVVEYSELVSKIFQFCWWKKPKYPEKTTQLLQVTDQLSSTPHHELESNSQC